MSDWGNQGGGYQQDYNQGGGYGGGWRTAPARISLYY